MNQNKQKQHNLKVIVKHGRYISMIRVFAVFRNSIKNKAHALLPGGTLLAVVAPVVPSSAAALFSTVTRRIRPIVARAVPATLLILATCFLLLAPAQRSLAQTPNTTINFQSRILLSSGAVVPDGNYHIEFKLYDSIASGASAQGACSLNSSSDDCWWLETRTTGNLVRVVNGYVSVNLGSVTAFSSTIPWSQDLYVTMRVGGSAGAASWDTEMTNSGNRMKLNTAPLALVSNNVRSSNRTSANSDNITIQSGNTTTSGNSGNISLDTGTAAGTTGTITLGATSASALTLGRSGLTTSNAGGLTVSQLLTANGGISIGTQALTGTTGIIDYTDFDVSADGLITLAPDGGGTGITLTPSAALTTGLDVSNANITNGVSLGATTLLGTTAVINFTNFDVSSAGAVVAVGVNSGAGLLQGALGLTVTGAASSLSGGIISLNASSNFATNINTGTSTGAVSIGNSLAGAIALQSASDVTLTTAAGSLTNILTGNLKVGNGTPGVTLNGEDVYIEGTLEVDGAQQFDGALVANSTATFNGALTVGDASGDTVAVNSGVWTFANDTTVALTGGVNGLNIDSNTLSVDATNNRVGIGTAAPGASLDISGAAGTELVRLSNSTTSDSSGIFSGSGSPEGVVTAQIGSLYTDTTFGKVYKKGSGDGTNTGWEEFAAGSIGNMAKMTRVATQSITGQSYEKIAFDTEVYDVGGIADPTTNDRFNILKNGKYLITASYRLDALADNEFAYAYIYKNGTNVKAKFELAGTGGYVIPSVTTTLDLVVGDYIEFYVYQYNASAKSTGTAAAEVPEMSVIQVDAAGGGTPEIAARVYNDANISISTGADTALTFNSERYDTSAIHSTASNTDRLTAITSGKYLINCNVGWAANSTGLRYTILRVNGTSVASRNELSDSAVDNLYQNVTTIYSMNAGDYAQCFVRQDSGGNLSVVNVANITPEFMMTKLDGGAPGSTLQAAYGNGSTIDTTDARDIAFNLQDTTTDSNFLVNLMGQGDFILQDAGVAYATFADTGAITFAPTSGEDLTLNFTGNGRLDVNPVTYENNLGAVDIARSGNFTGVAAETANDLRIAPSLAVTEPASGTFTWNGANIDLSGVTVTAGAGTTVFNGLRVAGVSDADAGTVNGILIDTLTGTAATERGLSISSGWDANIYLNDTTAVLGIADGGALTFNDGTNTLLTVTDGGTVGNLDVSGTLTSGTTDAFSVSATGGITSTEASGAYSLRNTSSGSGLVLQGTNGAVTTSLRIVNNTNAWADAVTSSYFQVTNSTNNNLTFMGGGYGTDTQLTRVQFASLLTQITDTAFTATPVPTALLGLVSNVSSKVVLSVDAGTTDRTADAVQLDVDVNSASVDGLYIDLDVGTALSAAETATGINIDVTGLAGDNAASFLYGINLNGDVTSAGSVRGINVGGSFDVGIDISGTGTTTDISLQNGETIDNNVNGTISLTATTVAASGAITAVGVNSGAGLLQGSLGLTVTGNTSLSTTAGNTVVLGNSTGTFQLDSTGLDVTTAGALSGITTLTGGTTLTLASTGAGNDIIINGADILDVQDNATFAGMLDVTGTGTFFGSVTIGDAVTDGLSVVAAIQGTNALIFDGSSNDTNEITLTVTNPGSDFTITLPAETGTICTTGSVCTGYAPAAGAGYALTTLGNLATVAINTSLLPAVNDTIDLGDDTHRFRDLFLGGDTLHLGTSTTDEGVLNYATSTNILSLQSTGTITLNSSTSITGTNTFATGTGAVSLQGDTTVVATKTLTVTSGLTSLTGNTTGDALVVSNSTSTGAIFVARDNATAVLTIANGGATTFQNQTDSTTAFQVQNSAGTSNLIVADTTNSKVGIAMAPSSSGATVQVTGNVSATTGVVLAATGNSSSTITKSTVVTAAVNANDVVIINTSSAGQVTTTSTGGSTGVFGIATQTLGAGQTQNIVIGGIYQVTADTSAVAIGDNLITSSTTGYVTPGSNPTIGQSVGRALSSKSAGSSGLVWVQVTPGAGGASVNDSNAIGSITNYAGSTAPVGWLIADGTAVSRTTYAELFTAIGTTYGVGDGSSTFNLPDFRGRSASGAGTGIFTGTISSVDTGTERVTLTSNNSLYTGVAVLYDTTSGAIGGLTDNTTYYAIRVSATQVSLATTRANAVAGTAINLTSSGSGVQTLAMSLTNLALGSIGGEDVHSLLPAELPVTTVLQNSHNHTQDSHNHTQNAHEHLAGTGGNGVGFVSYNNYNADSAGTAGWGAGLDGGSPGGYWFNSLPTGNATATNQAATATNQAATATNQAFGSSTAFTTLNPYTTVNYIIRATTGVVNTANGNGPQSAKMRRDAALSLTSGSVTKVTFDAEEYDVGGIADTSSNICNSGTVTDCFNIKKAGKYLITAAWRLPSVVDDGEGINAYIYKNGVLVSTATHYSSTAGGFVSASVTETFDLAVNDYIEMYIMQVTGAVQNTSTVVGDRPTMSVTQLDTTGNATTLQGAYDMGRTITATDARDILFTLADTATDPNFLVNMAGQGDFILQDAGVAFATFSGAGAITLAPTSGEDLTLNFTGNGRLDVNAVTYENNLGVVDIVRSTNFTGIAAETANELRIAPSLVVTEPGSGTFTWNGSNIDMSGVTVTAGAGTTVFNGLRVAGVSDADAGTVNGILVDTLTGTAATERGLSISSGWDANLFYNDTTTQVQVLNTGVITYEDDAGNDLLTVTDAGTTGNVVVTGTFSATGLTGIGTTPVTGRALQVSGISSIKGTSARLQFEPANAGTTNLWNIDNSGGTFRIFREDYSATGTGANGAVVISIDNTKKITLGESGSAFAGIRSCTYTFDPASTASGATTIVDVEMGVSGGCSGAATDAAIVSVAPPAITGFASCDVFGCTYQGGSLGNTYAVGGSYRFLGGTQLNTVVRLAFINGSSGTKDPSSASWTIWYIDP